MPTRLLQSLGLLRGSKKQAGGYLIQCPWHADKDASCSVQSRAGKILVHCFGCGFEGDSYHLVAQSRGLDMADFRAVKSAHDEITGSSDGIATDTIDATPESLSAEQWDSLYRALAPLAPLDQAREYLAERKIYDEAMADGWLCLPPNAAWIFDLKLAVDADVVTRSGILSHRHNRLVIPWRDWEGRIRTIQRRRLDDSSDGSRYVFAPNASPMAPFGADKMVGGKVPILCEGAVDALSLRAMGHLALGTPGGVLRKEWASKIGTAYMGADNDAAGKEHASKWCTILDHGTPIHPVTNDWNQDLVAGHVLVLPVYESPATIVTSRFASGAQMSEVLPAKDWVSDDLKIGPGRPTLVAGYGFSGKTLACQSMAIGLSTGTTIFGVSCNRASVIHYDFEQGRYDTTIRYQRLAKGAGQDLSDASIQVEFLPAWRLNMPDTEARLRQDIQDTRAKVAIIDSLRASLVGIDENDASVREHLDLLTRVSSDTGCAFVVIHHAGKGATDRDAREVARGSSAIFDACGTVITMHRSEQDDPITCAFAKVAASAGKMVETEFQLDIVDRNEGVVLIKRDIATSRWQMDYRKVRDAIRALGTSTLAIVSESAKLSRPRTQALVEFLLIHGKIVEDKKGKLTVYREA